MGNLGGGEILVILFVALIVLGPTKLPEAARQIGRAASELRRMSGSFQRELREAIHDPIAETKAVIKGTASTPTSPKAATTDDSSDEPSDEAKSEGTDPSSTSDTDTPEA